MGCPPRKLRAYDHLGLMSRRFCTTASEILLLQRPCQPEKASPARAVLTLQFLRCHIDNLEGDTERVMFADGSEPYGEGGSSMLEISRIQASVWLLLTAWLVFMFFGMPEPGEAAPADESCLSAEPGEAGVQPSGA